MCVGPNAIIAPQVAFDYAIVHGNEGLVVHSPHLTCASYSYRTIHCRMPVHILTGLSSGSPIGPENIERPQRSAETGRFCLLPMDCWSHQPAVESGWRCVLELLQTLHQLRALVIQFDKPSLDRGNSFLSCHCSLVAVGK